MHLLKTQGGKVADGPNITCCHPFALLDTKTPLQNYNFEKQMEVDKSFVFSSLLSPLLVHSVLLLLMDAQVSNFVSSFLPPTGFPLCFFTFLTPTIAMFHL